MTNASCAELTVRVAQVRRRDAGADADVPPLGVWVLDDPYQKRLDALSSS